VYWATEDRAVNLMQISTLFLHLKCLQTHERTVGHRTFREVFLLFRQQHHWHLLAVMAN